jgi:hypothetical protein
MNSMFTRRFVWGTSLLVTIAAVAIGAVSIAIRMHRGDAKPASTPKAMLAETTWDVGEIESGANFGHTFSVRNAGDAPLTLGIGKGLCSCMSADVPGEPIGPGREGKVKLVASDSVKSEPMTPGPFTRTMHLLTNDPNQPEVLLRINATVVPRMAAEPAMKMISLDSSKPMSDQNRSVETYIYSQRWDRFELSADGRSRKDLRCEIEPATSEKLKGWKARCGYRVRVTLPANMPDGRIAEWVEFAGKSPDGRRSSCRFDIQGRVAGRLVFYGPKIDGGDVLQLGTLHCGQVIHESLLMKINDSERQLMGARVETKPEFLHVRLVPYAGSSGKAGLYRIEVEIPADAPSCAWTGKDRGVIRLETDHPRFPVIELKVDFVLTGDGDGHVAAR